jgi:arabinose-5-phosphate isomerase
MNIKLVCFDFDGVFTDSKTYYDSFGTAIKFYNIKDGQGLQLLKNNNIKVGLISSYKAEKGICIDNGETQQIINHLSFDYVSVGAKEKKINILDKWLKSLNYTYDDVAYIGDDIGDIDILKKVKFSACPNDAVDDVKFIVNYICNNKGGHSCVREFIEKIMSNNLSCIEKYKFNIKQNFNNFINNINDSDLHFLETQILNCKGNVLLSGIGKSEIICSHFCNLLKSIGIKSFELNCINSLHGDIGVVTEQDIVILISKSGNTEELVKIIPNLKQKKCNLYGLCCNKESKFINLIENTIVLEFNNEINSNISNIPTNSSMIMITFINILVSMLSNHININEYKYNHPAGNIGKKLIKIKDIIKEEYPVIFIETFVYLNIVLLEMTKYSIGTCFFIGTNKKLLGILTDGDIRRLLINDRNLKTITINDLNKNFSYETNLEKYVSDIDNLNKMKFIPIIENKQLIGIIDSRDYL